MSQKMGLNSVTTVQGESVTPHSSVILDCAMHSTCGMGDSVVASSILTQTALYLAQYEAKRCTILVIYTEFTADQCTYIIIIVPCSTLCQWMRMEHDDMGSLGRTLQIDLPRDWANLALYRDVWRGVVSRC